MTEPRIVVTHGARATEELLVARVRGLREAARRDLTLLRRPVRVVVPSASLRDHLATVLVREHGALAGVEVTTLFAVALSLLRASGRRPGRGTALFDVLVRRFARLRDPLRERLDDLADGYAAVSATVRDVFDAGFETAHLPGLAELLDAAPENLATAAETDRAVALLAVAAATREALATLGLTHRSMLLREASEALEAGGPDLLPTRELLVHGFAEATGVVSDLLASLLRVLGGTLFLDRPPAAGGGFEVRHSERLAARLSLVGRQEEAEAGPAGACPPEVSYLAAPDPEAEMREIVRRIRALLAKGARPESIGVVARSLDERGALVRRHFGALAVPFSGGRAAAPPGRARRDLALLTELLRRGPALALERWLDARGAFAGSPAEAAASPSDAGEGPSDRPRASDLRSAFFAMGASRLEDLASLELDGHGAALPAGGLEAAAAGQSLACDLAAWASGERTFGEHLEALERLIERHLGWRTDQSEARGAVAAAVQSLDVPPELTLSYEDFVQVLSGTLAGQARGPLGGRGGGVRVLGAMEARGLTFDHLFLFSVTRDVFPRPVREDPLLPDRLRRTLSRLLPDLPVKASGFDEERHLFAGLLSSSPRVTVSWHETDADGDAVAFSPLVEGLRLALAGRGRKDAERAPDLLGPDALAWRPVEEELLVSALHGDRPRFAELLPLALEEVCVDGDPVARDPVAGDPVALRSLARSRLAVLEELDPDRRRREGRILSRELGPYFGFLGPPVSARDPRRGDPFVTALENLAVCPWQTFLRRLLRVAPLADPLASLPRLRGLLVGRLVHRVLERIAAAALGGHAHKRDHAPGLPVVWPDEAELDRLLAEEAALVLSREGLGLKGLARAAAELARPYLAAAARLDWAGNARPVAVAVEAEEGLRLAGPGGRERRVRFRADRVDRQGPGLIYTDYKTGSAKRAPQGRRRELIAGVESGEWLQAAAYAHEPHPPREGRYVFLAPNADDGCRVLRAAPGDLELRGVFESTLGKLLAAWERGTFFPRLVEPDEDVEPPRCASCRVAEACLRRDSGARGRLRRWAEAASEEAERGALPEASEAFLDLWWLRS